MRLSKPLYMIFPVIALMLFLGCSGSQGNSLAPPVDQGSAADSGNAPGLTAQAGNVPAESAQSDEHSLLGAYRIRLYESGEFEVARLRNAEMHVNVKAMLFPPNCLDCFKAQLIDLVGNMWNFKFTIRNPTGLTGYDCRVTLLNLGGIELSEPSSYTTVFALPDDPDPINPFVVFDTGDGQNRWLPQAQASTFVTLIRPTGTYFSDIIFAIDGSYPGNQEDPYRIGDMNAEPPSIDTDGTDTTNLFVNVYDWQTNVNYVTVDLTSIGGSGTAEMSKIFGNTWLLENVSYQAGGDGPGTRHLLVTASSAGQTTYNYLDLLVTGQPEPFSVQIEQSALSVITGENVDFTAKPTGGLPPYYYDWDMDYDGLTFTPDASGDKVTWDWDTPGTYTVKLRGQDYGGSLAWADAEIKIVVTMEVKIVIESPNGGETWACGSNHEIKWESYNFDGPVYIDYSKDGFLSDVHSIAADVPNSGSYQWKNLPLDPTVSAKVRITSTYYPSVSDVSDADFTMTPQPYFSLLAPNGNEVWLVGGDQTISWNSGFVTGTVDLQYSKDDFAFDIHPIAAGVGNTGSYLWKNIPDDESDKVKVRIKMSDDPGVYDISDNYFSISGPWICVTSPNGGEQWYAGTDEEIQWESLGITGNVKIEYSKDFFISDIHEIIASVPNTGGYMWQNIPLDVSDTVLVRITSISAPSIKDLSDNYFSLTGPWIKVKTPNGGEQWIVDGDGLITWDADPNIVNVSIKLSKDSGGTYPTTITASTPNDGSFTWAGIPAAAATDTARVKIAAVAIPSVSDTSNANFAIKGPWIQVSSPNGGEQFLAGSDHDILWTSGFMSGKLTIEYSKDNFGSDIHQIATNVTDDGSFLWQDIPNDYSTTVKIRIKSIDHPSASDTSDGNFTILTPSITVLAPNGGEKFYSGNDTTITWTSSNLTGTVAIHYSKDNFVSDVHAITTDTPNDGSFLWQGIPADYSTTVRVRVMSTYDNAIFDKSNGNFEIKAKPSITVTQPNGGENWLTLTDHDVTWTSANVTGTLFIDYSKDNFVSDIHAIATGEVNDGSYLWHVPNDVSTTVKVRVSMTDDPSINDKSNSNFTISKPYITVTYPNGGETFAAGGSETITWNSLGITGTVFITYSKDNFVSDFHTIKTNVTNTGSYLWDPIPDEESSTVKVRIASTDDPSVFDSSNNYFSIYQSWIQVLNPNGGEYLTVGGNYDIKWSSFLVSGNVDIVYSRSNFNTYSVIALGAANTGNYLWNPIPNDPGDNVKVGVGASDDPGIFDASNSAFEIGP